MGRKLVVAAVSARPYVALAMAAGYQVIALDIFADVDTQAQAQQVLRLPYADGAFQPQAFAQALDTIMATHAADDIAGLVYGSGFESHPALLHLAEQRLKLIGNSVESVRRAKHEAVFFELLRQYDILHPETRTQAPLQSQGWLRKCMGGSGGTQVQRAPLTFRRDSPDLQQGREAQAGIVYQREISGTPVSLLFLANGKTAAVVGFNQQFCHAGQGMPFRYGGLVSHAALDAESKVTLHHAAQQLTSALSLRGLNSLDAILGEDGRVYVLEINPRLTASAGLYETDIPLMDLLVQACGGDEIPAFEVKKNAHALAVCYAPRRMKINAVSWPAWVADIPPAGTILEEGDPCCTVQATADNAAQAWSLAQSRMASLFRQ